MGYRDGKGFPDRSRETCQNLISGAADQIRRDMGDNSYGAFESALYLYCARPASLPRPELRVDGEPWNSRLSATPA